MALIWGYRSEYMVDRALKRAGELRPMIRNPRVPVPAKVRVWSSYVRPLLEYSSEVWMLKIAAVQQ